MSPKDQSSIIPSDRIVVLIPDETISAKQGALTVVEKNQPEIGKVIALGGAGYYDDGKVRSMPEIKVGDVFAPGDPVRVTGTSKGKGFAGVVKRHHFAGGPRTHGQSDRERAPGSIGQTTTPGRVYRGKRMAGRMVTDTVTVRGLKVIAVDPENNTVTIKGLVPGGRKGLLLVQKEV